VVAVTAGIIAGSPSLIGFGIDSVIENLSGIALLWRLQESGHSRETIALRIVGVAFLLLAGYVAYEAVHDLIVGNPPDVSYVGIVVASLSLIVMPLLARSKRRVAMARSHLRTGSARGISSPPAARADRLPACAARGTGR
jgi:divalent metal cation (Fe/Co/Zn/Cd) transporter